MDISTSTATGLVVFGAAALYALLGRTSNGKAKKRRLSFTSQMMAAGSWPENMPMAQPIINAAVLFGDAPPTVAGIKVLMRQMMTYKRFAGTPTKDPDTGNWEFRDPEHSPPRDQDLDKHLTVIELDDDDDDDDADEGADGGGGGGGGGGEPAMWAAVNEQVMKHGLLKPDPAVDPWWEMVLIKSSSSSSSSPNKTKTKKKKSNQGGGNCVLFRVHHTVGDGIALVGMVRDLMTTVDGKQLEFGFLGTGPKKQQSLQQNQGGGGGGLSFIGRNLSAIPIAFMNGLSVAAALGHCLTLGLTAFDSDTKFTDQNKKKIAYSAQRSVVLLPDLPMPFIKALKNAASSHPSVGGKTTVNDVLSACLAGAVRRYCVMEKDPLLLKDGPTGEYRDEGDFPIQTRALLPVAFPRGSTSSTTASPSGAAAAGSGASGSAEAEAVLVDRNAAMRNLFCMMSCALPVGTATPLKRLAAVNKTTSHLKKSPRALVQLVIQNSVLPWLPLAIGRQTCFDIFSRHSCVFTNVPGPDKAILYAGAKVLGIQMVFPNLLTQVSMMSYAGNVCANCVVDPAVISRPQLLRRCFLEELESMATALNVPLPEGGLLTPSNQVRLSAIDKKLGLTS